MNLNITEIANLLTTLLAGGGAGWCLKSKRRAASAEAEKNEIEARDAEFELLRKQIDLNQKQNIDLIEQLGRKEERFADQTNRLREVQASLTTALERITELTLSNGRLQRNIDYLELWHCRQRECPSRKSIHSPEESVHNTDTPNHIADA